MSSTAKKKQFRNRAAADEEEDEEEGGVVLPAKSLSQAKKKGVKEIKPSKASLLSFGDDEEEADEALQQALKARKAKASKEARKALDRLESESQHAGAQGPAYGTSSGEYTAEKMAELRKSQPFQLPSKPKKKSTGRVTFEPGMVDSADDKGTEAGGSGEAGAGTNGSTQILDESEVQRLKEKKERSRRMAMEDFVPFKKDDDGQDGAAPFSKLRGDEARAKLHGEAAAGGEENVDEWEQEMIRRGARRAEPLPAGGGGGGGGGGYFGGVRRPSPTAPLSLFDGPRASISVRSVEEVLRDLSSTQTRVQEAHDRNVRAAEKARSEVETLRHGIDKLHKEFDETGERFRYFQEVRDYVSSLCGCLREKETMIKELDNAMAAIRREACDTAWSRRVEAQEDELQALKDRGELWSLQGYEPRFLKTLTQADENGGPKAVELDEFGRDKSYSINQAKERRREARLVRRRNALARAGLALGQADTAEAEASLSDAYDSDTEREVSRKRKLKLVEAGDVIFEDADDDFRSIDRVAQHFETWKRTHHKDYMTAFVSLGLPKIFEPFVRLEMVRWEPLTNAVLGLGEGDSSLENFGWYTRLFNYGQGLNNSQGEEDPDDRLVPQLVESVGMSMLTRALLEEYDPLSSKQTAFAIATVQHLLIYEPPKKALDALLKAPLTRLRECVKSVCVPLVKSPASPDAVDFQRRQVFRAVKLYRNLGLWEEVLSAPALAPLALTELLGKQLAKALDNQLTCSNQSRPAVVECLGILQAVANATPAKWVLARAQDPPREVHKLLQRIDGLLHVPTGGGQGATPDPLRHLTAKLREAFGDTSKKR